jgi:DNA-directed RNA polymerase subunit K/omega
MEKKKEETKQLSAMSETRDLKELQSKSGNIYESIAIVSRRSDQLNSKLREELHSKLEEFATHTDNLEEVFENREQIEISKYYEKLPKPTLVALNEFLDDKINYRYPEVEENKI